MTTSNIQSSFNYDSYRFDYSSFPDTGAILENPPISNFLIPGSEEEDSTSKPLEQNTISDSGYSVDAGENNKPSWIPTAEGINRIFFNSNLNTKENALEQGEHLEPPKKKARITKETSQKRKRLDPKKTRSSSKKTNASSKKEELENELQNLRDLATSPDSLNPAFFVRCMELFKKTKCKEDEKNALSTLYTKALNSMNLSNRVTKLKNSWISMDEEQFYQEYNFLYKVISPIEPPKRQLPLGLIDSRFKREYDLLRQSLFHLKQKRTVLDNTCKQFEKQIATLSRIKDDKQFAEQAKELRERLSYKIKLGKKEEGPQTPAANIGKRAEVLRQRLEKVQEQRNSFRAGPIPSLWPSRV